MTEQKVKFMLPTQKSGVDLKWTSQKIGMIGQAGIGKSTFWSYGEKTLFIQTEAGLGCLDVMKVPVRNWADLAEVIVALQKAHMAGEYPYDTIVIDTIDNLVSIAEQDVVEFVKGRFPDKAGLINSLFDYPGASKSGNPAWGWRTDRVFKVLNALDALPSCTVFVGHLGTKEVDLPTSKISRETITIGGQLGAKLVHWPDHFLNITGGYTTTKRTVRTIPTATIEAKSRGGIVKDGWIWSENLQDDYRKFRGLFS